MVKVIPGKKQINQSTARLQKFRRRQLQQALDSGLRKDINVFRDLSKDIPKKGFLDQRSAFAWMNGLPSPIPTLVKEGRDTATPQEENELELWLEKSLVQQNQFNKTILRLVAQTLCKKYTLGDEWIETVELLLLYPEDSAFIKLPELFSFKRTFSNTEGTKIEIVPSKDAVPSDFESKEFSESFWTARKAAKVDEELAKDSSYQVLLKHAGKRWKQNPTVDLLPHQPMWPWMETLHEVNGLLQFFSDIDSQAYKQIITQLGKVFDKLAHKVVERELHMSKLQESYTKKVNLGELTPEQAQSEYESNLNAISKDLWQKEDLQIAGSVLKKADKLTKFLEKGWQNKMKKAVASVPQRKRLKID